MKPIRFSALEELLFGLHPCKGAWMLRDNNAQEEGVWPSDW